MAVVSSLRPVSGSAEEILELLREWDAADDPEPLVIATSGSTGRPKRVVLSRDAMRASALATHERLGGPGRWVLNLPPTYVAGVQVLYRSVVAGNEPLFDRVVATSATGGPTSRWCRRSCYRALSDDAEVERLARCSSSAGRRRPAGPRGARAGGGSWHPGRADVRDERDLRRLRVRRAAARRRGGPDRRRRGAAARAGAVRRLRGRSRSGRPPCSATAGSAPTTSAGSGEDGRLRVTGRADDVIISGGVKVPGPAVAERIRGAPDGAGGRGARRTRRGVGRARRRLRRRRRGARRARDHVGRASSRAPGRPGRSSCLPELPLLPNGKIDRRRLRELALDG